MPACDGLVSRDVAHTPARGGDAQARAPPGAGAGPQGSPPAGGTATTGPRGVAVRVCVRTDWGDIECTVPSCLSVAALKDRVLSAAGAPAALGHSLWLRFSGEALQDQHALAHYRIVNGTILSLAVRVRGGGVCMSAPAAGAHLQLPPPAGAREPRLGANAERGVAGAPADDADHRRKAAGGLDPPRALEDDLVSVLREWKLTDATNNLVRHGVISMERLRDVSLEEVKELELPFATAKVFRKLILHLSPVREPIADTNADSVSIPEAPSTKDNKEAPGAAERGAPSGVPKKATLKGDREDSAQERQEKTPSNQRKSRTKDRSRSRSVASSSSDSESPDSESSDSDGSVGDLDVDDAEKAIDSLVKALPRKVRKMLQEHEDCPPEVAELLKLQAKPKKKKKSRKGSAGASTDGRTGPLSCKKGDELQVIEDEDAVKEAFEKSDATFASHMREYLGESGTVLKVDKKSVRLEHEDGQECWWAYGAVTAASSRSKSTKKPKPKSQWEKVFARYAKFWRRIARMAAVPTLPGDLMTQMEVEFFQKGTIKTLTDAHWDIDRPITRIVLHGVRDFKVMYGFTCAP